MPEIESTVIIHVGGGCLREVVSNVPGLRYVLIDADNHAETCEVGYCDCELETAHQDDYKIWEDDTEMLADARILLIED